MVIVLTPKIKNYAVFILQVETIYPLQKEFEARTDGLVWLYLYRQI